MTNRLTPTERRLITRAIAPLLPLLGELSLTLNERFIIARATGTYLNIEEPAVFEIPVLISKLSRVALLSLQKEIAELNWIKTHCGDYDIDTIYSVLGKIHKALKPHYN